MKTVVIYNYFFRMCLKELNLLSSYITSKPNVANWKDINLIINKFENDS